MTTDTLRRMWINQPSTLQPHHDLHGVRVLAQDSEFGPKYSRIWFTSGDVVSMEMFNSALSRGWPATARP